MDNGDKYSISNNAIGKYLSQSSVEKSGNLGVQLSVLQMLPEVINASIDAEIHPDYKKDENGIRSAENGIGNKDILVHRMYGAVEIDSDTYRVKTTMHEYKPGYSEKNTPHSYEVTKIEVLENTNTPDGARGPISANKGEGLTIGTTKLLQGVEKSYDKGKYLLEESKNQSAESGNIRYRMRAKGDESLPWNETLGVLSDVSKKKSPNDNTSALSDSPSRVEASGLLPNQSEKSAAMVARITDNLKSLLENIPDDGLGANETILEMSRALEIQNSSSDHSNYNVVNVGKTLPTEIRISDHSANPVFQSLTITADI